MHYFVWITLGVAVTAFLIFKQLALVRPETAQQWLKQGARVIDVRSDGEFKDRHLLGTVNIPLDRLRDEVARLAPSKEQPLLLHCLSGGRSGMGTAMLKKIGYRNVFNLGSYGRAERILGARGGNGTEGTHD